MNPLYEWLSQQPELNPDKHDGSYELVRETARALSTVDPENLGIEDLDMLYLTTVGTWKSSFENKKKKINESNLMKKRKSI